MALDSVESASDSGSETQTTLTSQLGPDSQPNTQLPAASSPQAQPPAAAGHGDAGFQACGEAADAGRFCIDRPSAATTARDTVGARDPVGLSATSSTYNEQSQPDMTHRAYAPRSSGPLTCGECERPFLGGSTTTRCMASHPTAQPGSGGICGCTVHVNCLRRHMTRWHPDCPVHNIADGPPGTLILAREPLRDPQQDAKEAAAVDAEDIRRLMAYSHALQAAARDSAVASHGYGPVSPRRCCYCEDPVDESVENSLGCCQFCRRPLQRR